jgi:signal transduction histidine kinase
VTGPPPTLDEARASEDAAALAGVSGWTGQFTNPAVEAAFREQNWLEWSTRLRVVSLTVAVLFLAFGYTDYLTLGFGAPLYVCWAARLATLAGAAGLARVTYGAQRPAALDRAALGAMLLFATAFLTIIVIETKPILLAAPGAIVMVLAFYLFVPTRFEAQLASALFLSIGFVMIAGTVLAPSTAELATVGIELLICNVLGGFTALRTHALQRREYASLRQVQRRARFEELIARLSTRFITLPADAVEEAIDSALAEIGRFTGVDRTYIFEFDAAQHQLSCTHEWCGPGVAPRLRAMQRVPYDRFSWGVAEILAGRPFVLGVGAGGPPAALPERAELTRLGVRSAIALPLVYGREVLGSIGFHSTRDETHWDERALATLRMVGEMIVGLIVRRRTLDELRLKTQSLEASVTALEQSNAELQQFAYVASHDLQEPLRSISSFSSLLAARYPVANDPKAQEFLRYLKAAATRMHALITNLLDYSRLDSDTGRFVPCDVAQIVRHALENLHASIHEFGAHVSVGALPELQGDPAQLMQVFQNLIGNALKFRGERRSPVVAVTAERSNGSWLFSVADNGIGIEPKYVPRLFQVFTRLHTQDQYPGTGIGLAVCRRIIERHRGRIWVEPNTPNGTIFRFTLPAG